MQGRIKFIVSRVFLFTSFIINFFKDGGIEVVSVILAHIYTFVIIILMITECPLLKSHFSNQDICQVEEGLTSRPCRELERR